MKTIEYKGYTVMTDYLYDDMSILIFVRELNTKFSVTDIGLSMRSIPTKNYIEGCIDLFLSQKRELIKDSFNKSFSRSEGE